MNAFNRGSSSERVSSAAALTAGDKGGEGTDAQPDASSATLAMGYALRFTGLQCYEMPILCLIGRRANPRLQYMQHVFHSNKPFRT